MKIQHKNCLQSTLRKKKIDTLFAGLGGSVLGKTVPEVLSTARKLLSTDLVNTKYRYSVNNAFHPLSNMGLSSILRQKLHYSWFFIYQVKGRTIPAHGFVLASRSQYCHQLICENKENRQGEADERTKTIPLHENVDYIAFLSWLRRLYSGGDVCDEEVFVLKDVLGKGKNGYHNLNEGGSKETNKTVNEMGKELDEEEMLSSRVLADLLFLAKTDRDVFPAPTCEEDEGFVQDSEDDVSEDDCTCLETRPLKKIEETMTKRDR